MTSGCQTYHQFIPKCNRESQNTRENLIAGGFTRMQDQTEILGTLEIITNLARLAVTHTTLIMALQGTTGKNCFHNLEMSFQRAL